MYLVEFLSNYLPTAFNWLAALGMFVLAPMCIWKRTRPLAGIGFVAASWGAGIVLWLSLAVSIYFIWGTTALILSIFCVGMGVLLAGIVAIILHGDWHDKIGLIMMIAMWLFYWIAGQSLVENYENAKRLVEGPNTGPMPETNAAYEYMANGVVTPTAIDELDETIEAGEPIEPPAPTDLPNEDALRELMARALSIPTPDALMHFTRFASRMNRFGPFNIYMIFAQRPGAGIVASKQQWASQGRTVRRGAIPILILKPAGPITQVFEELDTDPQLPRLPENDAFAAHGDFSPERLDKLIDTLAKRTKRNLVVRTRKVDFGRNLAGWVTGGADDEPLVSQEGYEPVWNVSINRLLTPAEQFTTLLHELGHLFCGHLGAFEDNNLKEEEYGWPDRSTLPHFAREIEAELVAWWLAEREGIITGSPIYLKPYIERAGDEVGLVDLDRVTRAVARVRSYLGDKH